MIILILGKDFSNVENTKLPSDKWCIHNILSPQEGVDAVFIIVFCCMKLGTEKLY